jgi:glycosyltransferase involved in cell wall biosynthesis
MAVKVCMLAFRHSGFDARVLYKESVSLQKNGYAVTVLAPCHPKKGLVDPSAHKYLGVCQAEHEGVKIIGVEKRKGILAVLNNCLRFYRKALDLNADVYHCQEGDFSVLIGIFVKRKLAKLGRKVKLIFDVHEYWPGSFAQNFKHLIFKRLGMALFKMWEKFVVKHCDLIFTANQIVRGHFLLLNRFLKIEILYNCPRSDLIRSRESNNESLILCHEGNLYFRRGLKCMVEALAILKNENLPVKLLIVGDVFGKEKEYLIQKIQEYGLQDTIEITGWLPLPEVGKHIARADLGLILYGPTINNMLAGPPNIIACFDGNRPYYPGKVLWGNCK